MNIAFYSAYTAMQAFQTNLNVISNNVANIQTAGYKKDRASFDDLLYNNINVNYPEGNLVGSGTKVESIDLTFTNSSMNMTGLPFDFALTNPQTFFAVQNGDNIEYTRNGAFGISVEDDGNYLVNANGKYVLDKDYQKITLQSDDGVTYKDELVYNQLGIFGFANPYELTKGNATTFLQSEKSGEAQLIENNNTVLLQGALENSSVDLADEMVNVITAQRAFQVNSKVLQTADEMEEIVNALRR